MSAVVEIERSEPAPKGPTRVRPATRVRHARPGVVCLWLLPVAVGVFLYLPIANVGVFAFNSTKSLFVFRSGSLHWFNALLHNTSVVSSIKYSLEIAVVTVAIAVPLGTALGMGLARSGRRLAAGGLGLILLCIITPEIALAFSLFLLFTDVHMTLSFWTIVAGHITFSIPFVTVMARARMAGLSREIEEAAFDLGAGQWTMLRTVILPQLLPAIVGSAMLVFVFSFDDLTTSLFLSGVTVSPLPVTIYSMIRVGISPEINAFGVLIMSVSVVLGLGSFAVATLRRDRSNVAVDRKGR